MKILIASLLVVLGIAPGAQLDARPTGSRLATAAEQRLPGWRLPLDGAVTRFFDPPAQPWLTGHRGVDLAGEVDAVVVSAGAGVVAFAGAVAGRGVVSVDHQGGLRTTYQPVVPGVAAGQPVTAGQPIGTLAAGHEGCPVAACLHWGLRRGTVYLDPLHLVRPLRLRLKPMS